MAYHTNFTGVDVTAMQRAIIKAGELASAAAIDVIYLFPTFNNVGSDAVVAILGNERISAFKKTKGIMINGVRFHLETPQKKRAIGPAIVLAAYVSLTSLENAIADYRTADWVFVPWSEPERDAYLSAHPNSVSF